MTVTLPDGSTLTLHIYGDEFGHYTATSDGYEVARGEDGFYYHVTLQGNAAVATSIRAKEAGRRSASDLAALSQVSRPGANNAQRLNVGRAEKMARMGVTSSAAVQRSPMRAGEPVPKSKSVVLLVNFKDVKFTTPNPQQAVHNLLNQPGYAENGAIGSAWDYYYDNSNGRFDPQFDVFGPYELDNNMSYYGGNDYWGDDSNPEYMAYHACQKAYAAGVDFTQYLNDQGRVKDVYIFYAGYAESDGNGSDTVWPHRWPEKLSGFTIVPGLNFTGYACSSELMGTPYSSAFTSIGTFCHEYGHVLGWPDFYDTNYNTNGTAVTFEYYSIMASGSYNADGNKPPALLAVERKLMGWLENEAPLALNGNHELPDIYTTDSAYILETSNAGEYYMFEAKNTENNKWDSGLSDKFGSHRKGMLVTHIDKSSSYISRWNNNTLNAYSNHPCARVVKANKSNSLSGWMFTNSVATLSGDTHSEFVPWSGTKHGYELKNINYADGKVTFYTGNPVAAESVTLNSGTASISLGKQITLTATVLPENASDKAVTWTSTDSGVASVEGGVVTGMSAGQATITATVTGTSLSATCLVTVVDEISTVSLVSAYQNDAEVSWENSPHTGMFRLELYSGGEQQINTTTAEKGAYFALLKPGTSYTLVITAIYGDQSEGTTAEISFSTPATTQEFPSILVDKATYASGEAVPLRVLHTSPTLQSVSWDVNGTAVSPPSVVLEPGRHRITVTITNEGGYSEKITKYITVQ